MGSLWIEPLDVLFLRGNRPLADGHGGIEMPPWPSTFSGALRSRIIVDRGVDFASFREGTFDDPELRKVVGRDARTPGTFTVRRLGLAAGSITYYPLSLDLVAFADENALRVVRLEPADLRALGVSGSFPLPKAAILRTDRRAKPVGDVWISSEGLAAHLRGEVVPPTSLVRASALWSPDPRTGIGMSVASRTVEKGLLYSADALALAPGVKLRVDVTGEGALLPTKGAIRLGGDARAATLALAPPGPVPSRWGKDAFRLILATPGVFAAGWLPPGVRAVGGRRLLEWKGLVAELVAAAVPRAQVVSGWSIGDGPKRASTMIPSGSVYWFERREGSTDVLGELDEHGLWPLAGDLDAEATRRRVEGFNHVWIGAA